MRVPLNLIKTGKYTTGGEFVFKNTNASYKGYYYELNDSYFIGKKFNPEAEEIIKLKDSNLLLSNAATFIYSTISGITSQQLAPKKIQSIQPNMDTDIVPVRYFVKQTNIIPSSIKEVNEDTYNSVLNNPLFQTTFVGKHNGINQSIDQANIQIPGLKSFLVG